MFSLKMFYEHLGLVTGFHTHHTKMLLKPFLSNVVTSFYHKRFLYPCFQNAYYTFAIVNNYPTCNA